MGNWTIVIHGFGPYGNKDRRADADHMAAEFANELRAVGQNVTAAAFLTGAGICDLDSPVEIQVPEPRA